MTPIASENDVHPGNQGAAADGGSETLLFDQLTPGNQYLICIRNTNSTPGNVTLVTSYLRGSAADIGAYTNYTNNYTSTCQNFKAAFRANATNYIVKRWASNSFSSNLNYTYQIPSGTVCQLGKIVAANLSGATQTIYLSVDATYTLNDAFGNPSTLTANGTAMLLLPCHRKLLW